MRLSQTLLAVIFCLIHICVARPASHLSTSTTTDLDIRAPNDLSTLHHQPEDTLVKRYTPGGMIPPVIGTCYGAAAVGLAHCTTIPCWLGTGMMFGIGTVLLAIVLNHTYTIGDISFTRNELIVSDIDRHTKEMDYKLKAPELLKKFRENLSIQGEWKEKLETMEKKVKEMKDDDDQTKEQRYQPVGYKENVDIKWQAEDILEEAYEVYENDILAKETEAKKKEMDEREKEIMDVIKTPSEALGKQYGAEALGYNLAHILVKVADANEKKTKRTQKRKRDATSPAIGSLTITAPSFFASFGRPQGTGSNLDMKMIGVFGGDEEGLKDTNAANVTEILRGSENRITPHIKKGLPDKEWMCLDYDMDGEGSPAMKVAVTLSQDPKVRDADERGVMEECNYCCM
ncbi:hypothetical protein NUU61_005958 [Penicillium alfredii]|uniref:Uncharacterized protein n=1 Tax=Penicillium alfredii TaxID=1506179 RepID=A0A9W9EZZ3_9EURO|nr:uncharacterized protein NUU61_005958 [Penicillium alfredii]KAJ5091088.1 hypothetical protein NUU61_005958 [Penicillium alfredii]